MAKAKRETYTVKAHNIYIHDVKHLNGDKVSLTATEAKAILDGDKKAGRKPRIAK